MITTYEPAITNNTPWDTKELLGFLIPLCCDTTITSIEVELQRPAPGTARVDQKLFDFGGINYNAATNPQSGDPKPDKISLYLLSPKRAASRVDALERMALALDLEAHEALLPENVVRGIVHAFTKIKNLSKGRRDTSEMSWDYRHHFHGTCGCVPPTVSDVVIRGNTRVRTAPPMNIKRLEQNYEYAISAAEKWGKKRDDALVRAGKIKARISRAYQKEFDANR